MGEALQTFPGKEAAGRGEEAGLFPNSNGAVLSHRSQGDKCLSNAWAVLKGATEPALPVIPKRSPRRMEWKHIRGTVKGHLALPVPVCYLFCASTEGQEEGLASKRGICTRWRFIDF